mmetsp:Transcript_36681/g.110452  ORF Transcript_36681/g.110452 Transcript_36681/m.110452 type:complete len:357 (-) Transcript_36681:79-1149(-)
MPRRVRGAAGPAQCGESSSVVRRRARQQRGEDCRSGDHCADGARVVEADELRRLRVGEARDRGGDGVADGARLYPAVLGRQRAERLLERDGEVGRRVGRELPERREEAAPSPGRRAPVASAATRSCLTSRLERTSKRAPLASSTGSACSRSAESRPSASRSDASRRTVCGWRQSGSSALPTGSSSSGPWLVRSSGSVARKASSCSGSSRCSSDEEQALSPIGRHSRACCLSIRAPWSIESSTDAIRKPAGRGRFSPCRSRRWHRSRAVCASPAAAPAAGGAPAPASARCAKRTMSTRSVHENTSTNRCSAESHTGRHVAPCDASAASACFMGRSASSVTTLPWVGSSSKISCCSRM